MGLILIFFILFAFLVWYALASYRYKIAKNLSHPHPWMAFVPVIDTIQLFQLVRWPTVTALVFIVVSFGAYSVPSIVTQSERQQVLDLTRQSLKIDVEAINLAQEAAIGGMANYDQLLETNKNKSEAINQKISELNQKIKNIDVISNWALLVLAIINITAFWKLAVRVGISGAWSLILFVPLGIFVYLHYVLKASQETNDWRQIFDQLSNEQKKQAEQIAHALKQGNTAEQVLNKGIQEGIDEQIMQQMIFVAESALAEQN